MEMASPKRILPTFLPKSETDERYSLEDCCALWYVGAYGTTPRLSSADRNIGCPEQCGSSEHQDLP